MRRCEGVDRAEHGRKVQSICARPGGSYWQHEGRIGEARIPGPAGDIDDPFANKDGGISDCDDTGSNHGPFSQLEAGLSDIVNVALARSLAQRSFVPATAFGGARPGTVFTTGVQGLGYYRDTSGMGSVAGAQVADAGDDRQARPVVISLADLLCTETVPRRTRPRRLRVRKRIHGRREVKVPWDGPHAETLVACGRFRDAGLWAFDTFNPNCGSKALDYLEMTAADACYFQETKCKAVDLDQQARTAAGLGWRLAGSPARITDKGGVSSGVAVAVRSHLGMAQSANSRDQEAEDSRFCIRWLGAVCRGGLHLVSVYLRDSEGLSQANLDILHHVAAAISGLQGPWLIAGDFNIEPNLIRQSGWLQLVRGVVHAPAQLTCGLKRFDYFISSENLACAVVGVANIIDVGSHPHSPTRLFLRAALRKIMIRSLCKPAEFSAMLPAGCPPAPPDYSQIAPELAYNSHSDDCDRLNVDFVEWVRRVEYELADICGLEGRTRDAACCRCEGQRFAMKPAMGRVASQLPRVSVVTTAWRIVAAWLLQLLQALSVTAKPDRRYDYTALKCIVRNIRRLRQHDWGYLGTHTDAGTFRGWISGIQHAQLVAKQYVAVIRLEAVQRAKTAARHDVDSRRRSWQAWLQEGPVRGLGRQHRMSRTVGG